MSSGLSDDTLGDLLDLLGKALRETKQPVVNIAVEVPDVDLPIRFVLAVGPAANALEHCVKAIDACMGFEQVPFVDSEEAPDA